LLDKRLRSNAVLCAQQAHTCEPAIHFAVWTAWAAGIPVAELAIEIARVADLRADRCFPPGASGIAAIGAALNANRAATGGCRNVTRFTDLRTRLLPHACRERWISAVKAGAPLLQIFIPVLFGRATSAGP
jgi:hypothetical protein